MSASRDNKIALNLKYNWVWIFGGDSGMVKEWYS
jgi:hypothetical protein